MSTKKVECIKPFGAGSGTRLEEFQEARQLVYARLVDGMINPAGIRLGSLGTQVKNIREKFVDQHIPADKIFRNIAPGGCQSDIPIWTVINETPCSQRFQGACNRCPLDFHKAGNILGPGNSIGPLELKDSFKIISETSRKSHVLFVSYHGPSFEAAYRKSIRIS
jgi:hypothetical protein